MYLLYTISTLPGILKQLHAQFTAMPTQTTSKEYQKITKHKKPA